MRQLIFGLIATSILCQLAGCGRSGENVAMPRPRGYPRLVYTDTVYKPVTDGPEGFVVNSHATVVREPNNGPGEWYTVTYPQYGATVYFTFSRADDEEYSQIVDNRLQRISLNFGEAPFTTTRLTTPNGWEGAIFNTREGVALPVQFLITSPGRVVSGSLFLPSFAENPDSVRPAVEMIRRDIIRSLESLR